ncbi:MAG: hypothetical protein V4723_07595 [Pseudomonadota bacterium]
MFKPSFVQILVVLLFIALGIFAVPYLAAIVYFAFNKTIPAELLWDSWYRFWQVAHDDPVQRFRLFVSAGGALGGYLGAGLYPLFRAWSKGRSLHGDARWATDREIRKADLL